MALRDICKEKLVDGRSNSVRMKGDGRLTSKNIKKQVEEEGETLWCWAILRVFFFLLNFLPAFFQSHKDFTFGVCVFVCGMYVQCECWQTTYNCFWLKEKIHDSLCMVVSNHMFTFLTQALAPCHFKKWV